MKKNYALIIAVMLILSVINLSACTDNSNSTQNISQTGFNYSTDMQYYYNNISDSKLRCTESEKGYYYRGDHGIVIFIDKNTMDGTPLCNKVNCLHNDPDECDAYGYGIIQYYNGYLFTDKSEYDDKKMSDITYIYKVSEDGTNKEKITNGFKDMILDWFIHKSSLYYVTDLGLYRIPIDSPKSDPSVIIDFKKNEFKNVNLNKFIAYKNYVYISISSMSDDNGSVDYYSVKTFAYDIESEKLQEIAFDELTEITTFFNDSMITYQTTINEDNTYNVVYYISDLNGDNKKKYAEYPSGYYMYSDGEYIYVDNGAYVNFSKENSSNNESDYLGQTITVYDFKLETIDSFVLPFTEWIDMCPQGVKHFLLADKNENDEFELYYIDKNKIGNYNGSVATKNPVCKLNWKNTSNQNKTIHTVANTSTSKRHNQLYDCFISAKKKGYKVIDNYKVDDKRIIDGFSIKVYWNGDGGSYTGEFPIVGFNNETEATSFCNTINYYIKNKNVVAIVSIEKIPVEIYQMLNSIISGNAIEPISPNDFTGEMVLLA